MTIPEATFEQKRVIAYRNSEARRRSGPTDPRVFGGVTPEEFDWAWAEHWLSQEPFAAVLEMVTGGAVVFMSAQADGEIVQG